MELTDERKQQLQVEVKAYASIGIGDAYLCSLPAEERKYLADWIGITLARFEEVYLPTMKALADWFNNTLKPILVAAVTAIAEWDINRVYPVPAPSMFFKRVRPIARCANP